MIDGELRLRRRVDHVVRLAEAEQAALLGDLERLGRVGVLGDDVDALVEQRLGGVAFLGRVHPGVDPDDLELEVGVDRLRAEHERVDAHDHFGDREGDDVAGGAGLRQLGRDLPDDVAALVEAGVIGGDVRRGLEAGGVLEHHVRILRGHLDRRIHEAERGGEDQLVAGLDEALDGALGVGTFRHVLEEGDLDLVAELLLERLRRRSSAPGSSRRRSSGRH